MAARPKFKPRRRNFASRWRRLIVEQFETRLLLSAAPTGTDNAVTTLEGAAYVFGVADFGFRDPSDTPPNNFIAVRLTSLPPRGLVTDDTQPVVAGQLIPIENIAAGKLKFVPEAKANGLAYTALTFQVQDDGGTAGDGTDLDSQPKMVTFNITAVNPTPKASADNYYQSGYYDNPFFMAAPGVLGNDSDLAGSPLEAVLVRQAYRGVVTLNPDGSFLYRPNQQFFNPGYPDAFTYRATNGSVASAETLVTIAGYCWQWCTNGPTANDAFAVAPNTQLVVGEPGVLNNDLYSPFLRATLITGPKNGTLSLSADGGFSYTPDQDFSGTDSFTYGASDGVTSSGIAIASIIVSSDSRTPVGIDGGVNAFEDKTYVFKTTDFVASNPAAAEPAGFGGITIYELPYRGSILNDAAPVAAGQSVLIEDIRAGKLQYIPPPNANGYSSTVFYSNPSDLVYGVIDNGAGTQLPSPGKSLAINITPVNDPPVGIDSLATTQKDTPYHFRAEDFHFSDAVDGSATGFAAAKIASLPSAGRLMNKGVPVVIGQVVSNDEMSAGQFLYIPDPSHIGFPASSFTFQVQDDGGTLFGGIDLDATPKTMIVNVSAGDYLPEGTDRLLAIVQQPSVSVYRFSPDDFGFRSPAGIPPATMMAVKITTMPPSSLGRLEKTHYHNGYYTTYVSAGELIPIAEIEAGELNFVTFKTGAPLTSFTFQVQSIYGTDATPNTMTISTCSDCRQPVFDKYTFLEDNSLVVAAPGILANDRDNPAGLFPSVIAGPYHGKLSFSTDGSFTYAPNADYAGYDRIFYRARATDGDDKWVSSVTEAEFYVTPVNDPPEGKDTAVTVAEDATYVFGVTDFVTRLQPFRITDPRDYWPDDLLAVKIATLPPLGSLTLNGAALHAGQFISALDIESGKLRYLAPPNRNGSPVTPFTFQVQDTGGRLNGGIDLDPTPNTITINVTPVNDGPVNDPPSFAKGGDQSFTDESGPQSVSAWASAISAGPPDEAGQQVHFEVLSNSNAALLAVQPVVDADGKLKFTPAANVSGSAQIKIVLRDDGGTASGGVDTSLAQTFTIIITKAHVWRNAANGLDVTGEGGLPDGIVVADDVLEIINFLNAFGAQSVPTDGRPTGPYLDVNADGFVAPSDALDVINHINTGLDGEGEKSTAGTIVLGSETSKKQRYQTSGGSLADLIALLAIDTAQQSPTRKASRR